MTLTELQDSIRRVLGADLPLGEPTPAVALHLPGSAGRTVPRRADPAGRRCGSPVPRHGHRHSMSACSTRSTWPGSWPPPSTAGRRPACWTPITTNATSPAHGTLLHTQAQVALRRGHDPAAEALRELFRELLVDEQPLRRMGALIAGTDIRYPMPGPDHHALAGTFAPDLTLHTDQGTTSVAELMHTARPVLLDLADRPDLREAARDWQHSHRHPHGQDRSPACRRPPDPPGRPHRLGRSRRRTRRHRRARAARSALPLVRPAPASPEPAWRTRAGIVIAGIMSP